MEKENNPYLDNELVLGFEGPQPNLLHTFNVFPSLAFCLFTQ